MVSVQRKSRPKIHSRGKETARLTTGSTFCGQKTHLVVSTPENYSFSPSLILPFCLEGLLGFFHMLKREIVCTCLFFSFFKFIITQSLSLNTTERNFLKRKGYCFVLKVPDLKLNFDSGHQLLFWTFQVCPFLYLGTKCILSLLQLFHAYIRRNFGRVILRQIIALESNLKFSKRRCL